VPRQPGRLAKHDGVCARCPRPIVAKQDRIIVRGEGDSIHVDCASGADDVQPPLRASHVGTSPAAGDAPTVASTPVGGADPMPAAGDPPTTTRLVPVGPDHHAVIDAADWPLVGDAHWSLLRGHNGKLYAHRKTPDGTVYMHRLLAGTGPDQETDHVNGDGLDNRRENLRPATRSQNKANMGKPKRPDGSAHSSRFKGVSWDESRGRWQSKITVDGKCRNLGRYDDETEAARAYDAAALEAWGDFALTNAPETGELTITEPGLYENIPNQTYHQDPYVGGSVSNSDAKLILKAPALYRWKRDNPSHGTAAMNLGSAAHTRVLGAGDELVKIESAEYRTNDAKAARDKALAEGKIPLLGVAKPGKVCEWDVVDQMAKVLETHPLAPLLFAQGAAEVSAFYVCSETGVRRRCRFDFLPNKVDGQRLIVPDYKSTQDADPDRFGKHAADFGYDMADYTYTAALAALGIDPDARFVFVNQETTAPYLVSLTELNDRDREVGRSKTLRALRKYQECMATDTWPGYAPRIHKVSLPSWAHITEERTLMQEGLI
jgi:hypothetical protein